MLSLQYIINIDIVCYINSLRAVWYLKETMLLDLYRGADKSLARPGRKQATATEDFEFHISYL